MRVLLSTALLFACAGSQWQSRPAEHPVSRRELAFLRVTVVGPAELGEAMAAEGFSVVSHPAWHEDLTLRFEGGVGELRSDGYFVDQVRGDPRQVAQLLAHSQRVADFVRNSGTVEQRANPGM